MNFALTYLVYRFFHRLTDFFHHWYVHGLRRIGNAYMEFLTQLDETWALRVTLKHFFQPLYKDYTVVGRILGVAFRSGRVLLALFLYAVVTLIFGAVAIGWAAVPVVTLINIARPFFTGP